MSLIFHRTDRGYESAGLAQPLLSFRIKRRPANPDYQITDPHAYFVLDIGDSEAMGPFFNIYTQDDVELLFDLGSVEQEFHVGINERIWLPVSLGDK
jgi:hypothetical protein